MADKTGYIGRNPGDSSVVIARQTFSPTGVQTDFTFTSGYSVGYVDLFINGAKLIEGSDYTATNGSTISVVGGGATTGDILEAVAYKAFNLSIPVYNSPSNFSVSGNLDVSGDANVGIDTSSGLVLTSPNGTQYRIIVDNSGNLSTVVVP